MFNYIFQLTLSQLLLQGITSIILACLIHEAGHYCVAKYFGEVITFKFQLSGMIPRFIWTMPSSFTPIQKKYVALAGFGCEFIVAPILFFLGLVLYPVIAILHILCYNFYCGESSDFKWL